MDSDLKTEYKFQFSTKKGDDILVVHADTVDDLVLNLEEAKSKLFKVVSLPTPTGNATLTVNPKRICQNCGSEMEYKEGTSKAGKAYKGFFCKDKCGSAPVWVKD